jgi:hypothetical protein
LKYLLVSKNVSQGGYHIMTVGELKRLLQQAPDDNVQVLIPTTMEFTGMFYSPCNADSGMTSMGTDPDITEEDYEEMKLLNQPLPEEPAFLLVPCGFGGEQDHSHELN